MIKNISLNETNQSETFLEQQEEAINIDNINELCNLAMLNKFEKLGKFDESESEQNELKTIFRYK
jgi:hypothetical protein